MKGSLKNKRTMILSALALSLITCIGGCGSGNGTGGANSPVSNGIVSISQYKGLKIQDVKPNEVSNETLKEEIDSRLSATSTTKKVDRKTKDGDIVTVDYKGSIDGKEFEGGSAENVEIEIGSGTYVEKNGKYKGFEEQLIGHKADEDFDITVKFPDNYTADLSGKVAKFKIHIDDVSERKMPELNDAWVISNSEKSQTVDEYVAEVRKELEERENQAAQNMLEGNILEALMKNSKFVKEPEDQINKRYEETIASYKQYADSANMSLEDFLKEYMSEKDPESWKENMKNQAKEDVLRENVFNLIAEKEKLTLSDDEYKEQAEKLMKDYGYEKLEKFEDDYKKEEISSYLQQKKVMAFLVEKAEKVDKPAEATTSTEGTETPAETTTEAAQEATTKQKK